jgi:opacity protein-like surface antigen
VRCTVDRLEKGEVNMRRFVLGVLLAAGLSVAASGAAFAQTQFGYPNFFGYPGQGYGPVYGAGYGGGPYGTIPDPYGYGFPGSYQYPYGYPFGTPPIYGNQGGIGFTFNSLNNAPFGTTISIANTSQLAGGLVGFPGVRYSQTVLPLSAAGRISLAPTNAGNSFNEVVIR